MTEKLTYRVLRVVSQLETPGAPISSKHVSYVLDEPYRDVYATCQAAKFDGLLWFDRCGYRMTRDGTDALRNVRTGDYLRAGEEIAWKREALTGMTTRGEQSPIDRGAIPAVGKKYHGADQDAWVDVRKKLHRLGISVEDLVAGDWCLCPHCGEIWTKTRGCSCVGRLSDGTKNK